jgi:hypothetical protein
MIDPNDGEKEKARRWAGLARVFGLILPHHHRCTRASAELSLHHQRQACAAAAGAATGRLNQGARKYMAGLVPAKPFGVNPIPVMLR